MDVIICEDNPKQLKDITNTIHNYAMVEDNGINVVLSTANPVEVLTYVKNNKADCYFLDIELNHELTGIQLGCEIRKLDPLCNLIFVTTHSEMTILTFTYKLAAMDFITKDDLDTVQDRVLDTLKEAYKRYIKIGEDPSVNRLQLKISGRIRNIEHDAIYFFEVSPNSRKLILHLHNEQIEFSGRLKDYENLGENFYRCHRSYIVNKDNIQEIDTQKRLITMTNGQTCPASSRLLRWLH